MKEGLNEMREGFRMLRIGLLIAVLAFVSSYLFASSFETVQATPKECESAQTLAQAAIDRDLGFFYILVCEDPPDGFAIAWEK